MHNTYGMGISKFKWQHRLNRIATTLYVNCYYYLLDTIFTQNVAIQNYYTAREL